jgi:hypothetical protein
MICLLMVQVGGGGGGGGGGELEFPAKLLLINCHRFALSLFLLTPLLTFPSLSASFEYESTIMPCLAELTFPWR